MLCVTVGLYFILKPIIINKPNQRMSKVIEWYFPDHLLSAICGLLHMHRPDFLD